MCSRFVVLCVEGEGHAITVPLLFNLLDHAQWQHISKPWKKLAKQLLAIAHRSVTIKTDFLFVRMNLDLKLNENRLCCV